MLLITIMLLGGCFSAMLAAPKNRNPFGWFAIGALFPLIGIILATVLPPNPSALDVPQL